LTEYSAPIVIPPNNSILYNKLELGQSNKIKN
jgi:hypothetical protein